MKTFCKLLFCISLLSLIQHRTFAWQTPTWTDTVGIIISGDTIIKTAVDSWNAGAASVERLDYITDGWVETIVNETNTSRIFGLSYELRGFGLDSTDFAFYLNGIGNLSIRENEHLRLNYGSYNTGDTLRVERLQGRILYKLNGNVIYTSSQNSTIPLMANFGMYTQGATLKNMGLSPTFIDPGNTPVPPGQQSITWIDTTGITFIGDKIRKVTQNGWNAGAVSAEILDYLTDGWVETIVNETYTSRIFGLSSEHRGFGLDSIDFAFYLNGIGDLSIRENEYLRLNYGSYNTGDTLRIERQQNNILYKLNGNVIYTSTQTSLIPLMTSFSMFTQGASLMSMGLSPSFVLPPSSSGGHWDKQSNTIFTLDQVAIGTDSAHTDHLLSVKGKIASQGVKVTLNGWADYVLSADYDLMSIEDLEAFIKKNEHLPDIPSEKEVIAKGIYLENMALLQMKKIEELTLYLIRLNKLVSSQSQLIKDQKLMLKAFEERLNQSQKD